MSEEDENIDMVEDIGLVKKEISKPIDAKKDEKEEKDVSSEIDKWLEEDKKAAESGDLPKLNIPKKEDKPVEKEKIEDIPKQDVEEDSEEEVTIATSSNKEAALPNLSKNKNEVTVTVLGEKKEELLEDKQVYADEAVPETKIFGLRTTANREDQVMTFVTSNAERKGINIPDADLEFEGITEKDKRDIEFGITHRLDYIALSFVCDEDDVRKAAELVKLRLPNCRLVAKIENRSAIENIDKIIAAADGIMIARGDMGVAVPIYQVPMIQKRIIEKCNAAKKFVITATQMLEHMTEHSRPTRAEVADVANAIIDGTDFVMLSAETAVGRFPYQSVAMMNEIIKFTEKAM